MRSGIGEEKTQSWPHVGFQPLQNGEHCSRAEGLDDGEIFVWQPEPEILA